MQVEIYYQKYGAMVLRRSRKLLGNEELAQEVLQETFMRLLERPLPAICSSSYFYTVATNICLNIIKSKEYRRGLAPSGELINLFSTIRIEEESVFRHFMDRIFLGQDQIMQKIIIYHLIDEMTLEETATLLQLSTGQVRRRLHKFKEHSKSLWEE